MGILSFLSFQRYCLFFVRSFIHSFLHSFGDFLRMPLVSDTVSGTGSREASVCSVWGEAGCWRWRHSRSRPSFVFPIPGTSSRATSPLSFTSLFRRLFFCLYRGWSLLVKPKTLSFSDQLPSASSIIRLQRRARDQGFYFLGLAIGICLSSPLAAGRAAGDPGGQI